MRDIVGLMIHHRATAQNFSFSPKKPVCRVRGSPEVERPEPSAPAAHDAPVPGSLCYLRPVPLARYSTFDGRKYTAIHPVKQLGSVGAGPPKTLLAPKGTNTKLFSAFAATECAVEAGCDGGVPGPTGTL